MKCILSLLALVGALTLSRAQVLVPVENLCDFDISISLEVDQDVPVAIAAALFESNDNWHRNDADMGDFALLRMANEARDYFNDYFGVTFPTIDTGFLTTLSLDSEDGHFRMHPYSFSTSSGLPGPLYKRTALKFDDEPVNVSECLDATEGGFAMIAVDSDGVYRGQFGALSSYDGSGAVVAIEGERCLYGEYRVPHEQETLEIGFKSFAPSDIMRFAGSLISGNINYGRRFKGNARGRVMLTTGTTSGTTRVAVRNTLKLADYEGRRPSVISITQKDFEHGTYIIDEPGYYRLDEDISFQPFPVVDGLRDAYEAGFPSEAQLRTGEYDRAAFQLGFFAGIMITATGVDLDLNGHTLEQSVEHSLLQRFYANIELASSPFIPGEGPAVFSTCLEAAKNVRIYNGRMGRSSHHQIHGNNNANIIIEDIVFDGHELAAVSLNAVKGLTIRRCTSRHRTDVPVTGIWLTGRGNQMFADFLAENHPDFTFNGKTALQIRDNLRDAVNNVHHDVITIGNIDSQVHSDEYALFHNKFGVLDGNTYSFLTNKGGPAVLGFTPKVPGGGLVIPSEDVRIEDVIVYNQSAVITETPAISKDRKAVRDGVNSVLQIFNAHPDLGTPVTISSWNLSEATYVGNVISDVQLVVAKAALAGLFNGSRFDVSRVTIDESVVAWAEEGTSVADLVALEGFLCNGDVQFHVAKGVIAVRIDGTIGANLRNIDVQAVNNFGAPASQVCGPYETFFPFKSHPDATLIGYGGADTRGVSVAGSTDVSIRNVRMANVYSQSGSAIAFDVFTESIGVRVTHSEAVNITSTVGNAIGYRFRSLTQDTRLHNYCCNNVAECVHDDALPATVVGGETSSC